MKNSRFNRFSATSLAVIGLMAPASFAPQAQAAILYWNTTTTGLWSQKTNWWTTATGTANPANAPVAADTVVFNGTGVNGNETINLGALTSIGGITFNNTGTTTLVSDGTARTLTLGTGGITIAATAGAVTLGNATAGGNVLLALASGSQTWTNNSANAFTINNTVASFTRAAGAGLNFNKVGAGEFVMSTTVLPNTNDIVGAWATFGTGAATKYATNNAGTITGLTGTAAATAANLTDTTGTANYDLAAATGTIGASDFSANTIRYTGFTGTTAPGATSFTVNGLLNAGSSTWTIGTNNLTIGADKELVVVANGSVIISSAIGDNAGGASSLTKLGGQFSSLTLSGANTYGGGTTYSGSLTAASAGAFGTGSVTGIANSSLVFNTPVNATFSNNITTNSTNGGPVFTNASATSTVTLSGNNTFGTGSTWAIIAGSGVSAGGVVLTGNNNFGGRALELKNVSLTVGSAAALGSSGLIKFADDSGVAAALYLRNGVTLGNAIQDTQYATYTNTRTVTLGVTDGNATLSGVVDLHKTASAGTVNWSLDAAASATLTCSGVIKTSNTAVGKATLTKTGAGTVILSGSNTYSCDTTVAAGTLSLTKVNSNNETSRLTIATDAVLNLNHALSETVGTFYIGDVQQPAGTYVASGTQVTAQIGSPRITGTGKLVVSSGPVPLNNYANWISGFGVGGLTAANGDFDNDRIGNAAENILGSNPALPNTALTLVSSSGDTLKFRHSQSNTIASDLTKSYQWSTDFAEWKTSVQLNAGGTTVAITEATIINNAAPDNDLIEVTVTITSGPATRLFVRLAATQAP